ncbi:MAG: serine/threonine protein kinase [Planctomycetota bacterium]
MPDIELDDLLGQQIGSYRVERLIGRGGMGAVFLGTHAMLGTPAAIKVLAPEFSANPEMVARFEREARNAALLNHPNIVSVFDIGRWNGLTFMCMPFIEGKSLRAILDQGSMNLVEAMLLMDKILEAIAFAHGRTVLHRDLKPDNIIVTPEGHPRITDFGLARNMSSDVQLTHAGQVIGTPLYMPVEQWDAEELDERTDVYALGITFYEMLCGKPPFPPDLQPGHLFRLIAAADFLKPREIDDSIPVEVETVCLKMMALEASERYRDATTARNDLLDALQLLNDTQPEAMTRKINAARVDSKVGQWRADASASGSGISMRPGGTPGSRPPGSGMLTPIRPATGSGNITPVRRNATPISPISPPRPPSSTGAPRGVIPPPPRPPSQPGSPGSHSGSGFGNPTGRTPTPVTPAATPPGGMLAASVNFDALLGDDEGAVTPPSGSTDSTDLVGSSGSSDETSYGDTLLVIGGAEEVMKAHDAFAALEAAAGATQADDDDDDDDDEVFELTDAMTVRITNPDATAATTTDADDDDGWGPAPANPTVLVRKPEADNTDQTDAAAGEDVTASVEDRLTPSAGVIPADPFGDLESESGDDNDADLVADDVAQASRETVEDDLDVSADDDEPGEDLDINAMLRDVANDSEDAISSEKLDTNGIDVSDDDEPGEDLDINEMLKDVADDGAEKLDTDGIDVNASDADSGDVNVDELLEEVEDEDEDEVEVEDSDYDPAGSADGLTSPPSTPPPPPPPTMVDEDNLIADPLAFESAESRIPSPGLDAYLASAPPPPPPPPPANADSPDFGNYDDVDIEDENPFG